MMEGVKSRFPRLLPILKQEEVSDRVVRAVLRDEQEIRMHFMVNLAPVSRVLPVDLFDWLAEFFGVSHLFYPGAFSPGGVIVWKWQLRRAGRSRQLPVLPLLYSFQV